MNAAWRRPLPHGADQHHHRKQVHLAAEETHRRRRHALATTIACTAETEAIGVVFGQIVGAARLAGIVGAMQPAAARTALLPGTVGEVLINRKKKRPEGGSAGQFMVHGGVLRGSYSPFGVHPSGTSIK